MLTINERFARVIKSLGMTTHEAAEALGYRGIRRHRPSHLMAEKCVAILCPNVVNPYYATLVQSVQDAAARIARMLDDGADVVHRRCHHDSPRLPVRGRHARLREDRRHTGRNL